MHSPMRPSLLGLTRFDGHPLGAAITHGTLYGLMNFMDPKSDPTAVHADADVQATAPRRPPPCGGCTSWGRCQFRSVDPSGLISDP